jgi:hypothetical protein
MTVVNHSLERQLAQVTSKFVSKVVSVAGILDVAAPAVTSPRPWARLRGQWKPNASGAECIAVQPRPNVSSRGSMHPLG